MAPSRAPTIRLPYNGEYRMNLLLIAIACGVIAVLYGILTSRQVLASPAGNQNCAPLGKRILIAAADLVFSRGVIGQNAHAFILMGTP